MQLAADPRAPRRARAVVHDRLGKLPPTVVRDVELLTSELVTNAVAHAGLGPDDSIELVIEVSSARVRVSVLDEGPGFDEADIGGGFGLLLVAGLSDRWGVRRSIPTEVWFEVDV